MVALPADAFTSLPYRRHPRETEAMPSRIQAAADAARAGRIQAHWRITHGAPQICRRADIAAGHLGPALRILRARGTVLSVLIVRSGILELEPALATSPARWWLP
jgi:hypothetical protein